ncbi:MAG: hypothetical protein AB1445_15875 [Bacillota bacterium]
MRKRHVLLAVGGVMLISAQVLFPQVEPVMTGGKVIFSARGWSQFGVYLLSILALAGYMAVETPNTIAALKRLDVRPARALARLAVTGAGVGAAVYLAAPYNVLAVGAVVAVGVLGILSWGGVKTEF